MDESTPTPVHALVEPEFKPFDPDGDVQIYVRNLPHWRQPNASYFVTFRQDDSIPRNVLREWQDLRDRWAPTV